MIRSNQSIFFLHFIFNKNILAQLIMQRNWSTGTFDEADNSSRNYKTYSLKYKAMFYCTEWDLLTKTKNILR